MLIRVLYVKFELFEKSSKRSHWVISMKTHYYMNIVQKHFYREVLGNSIEHLWRYQSGLNAVIISIMLAGEQYRTLVEMSVLLEYASLFIIFVHFNYIPRAFQ